MSTLAVDLGTGWFLPNNYYSPPGGFYTVTESTTPLPTTSYNLYTSDSFEAGNNISTCKNSVIQPPESPDISLATTLEINYLGNTNISGGNTYTNSGLFTITLYPFINGSNIVIGGGATTTARNLTYSTNGVENAQYGNMAGYTVTVLNQSFSASSTNCTLYFSVENAPSAFNQ